MKCGPTRTARVFQRGTVTPVSASIGRSRGVGYWVLSVGFGIEAPLSSVFSSLTPPRAAVKSLHPEFAASPGERKSTQTSHSDSARYLQTQQNQQRLWVARGVCVRSLRALSGLSRERDPL